MTTNNLGIAYFLLFFFWAAVASGSEECMYQIAVKTDISRGSGTSSKISLTLKDGRGSQLNWPNLAEAEGGPQDPGKRYFQSGALDSFFIHTTCMDSPICSMILTSDNSGDEPDWLVERVRVYDYSRSQLPIVFEINGWLSTNKPPYSLTRTIDNCPTEICSHKILVKTGTICGAGTRANISLILKAQDTRDNITINNLEEHGRSNNPGSIDPGYVFFQKGAQDEFNIDAICMESISSITLTISDNSVVSPDWYVDYVEVVVARSGATPHENLRFEIYGWLATCSPPYSLTRTFYKSSQRPNLLNQVNLPLIAST